MKAFVVTGPRVAGVQDVPDPIAGVGDVLVDVELVGVCGTDVEFYTGHMSYLHTGRAAYPMRLGHEWCGVVGAAGPGVDQAWIGRRVIGDTMLGCGRCERCLSGRHHVCRDRFEVGISGGFPGALAERLVLPAAALHPLPASVGPIAGALVEPGGNAFRAVKAAGVPAGSSLLIFGPGTIGLLAAAFAIANGVQVHVVGLAGPGLALARSIGATASTLDELEGQPYDAVIDATNGATVPAAALRLVEPAGRVVYIGLAPEPSPIDTRTLVLGDLTAVGILGGSAGLEGAIHSYASGAVDPTKLVAATVPLERAGDVLAGWRPDRAGPGPKILVDLRTSG